jgi:hypothetical protein
MSLFWANGTVQAQTSDYGADSWFPAASRIVKDTLRMRYKLTSERGVDEVAQVIGNPDGSPMRRPGSASNLLNILKWIEKIKIKYNFHKWIFSPFCSNFNPKASFE